MKIYFDSEKTNLYLLHAKTNKFCLNSQFVY